MAPTKEDPLWSYWSHRWTLEDTPWHQPKVHPFLEGEARRVLGHRNNAVVLVPLCGKALELKWFYDLGHRVVGVEYVEASARQFFSDSALAVEECKCPSLGCTVLQTPDGRLKIFCCSIFDLGRCTLSPVDVVWDRASLVAVPEDSRQTYARLLKSLLAPNSVYLLVTCVHLDSSYTGFPKSVGDDEVYGLFGDTMNVQKISESSSQTLFYIKSPIHEVTWIITNTSQ